MPSWLVFLDILARAGGGGSGGGGGGGSGGSGGGSGGGGITILGYVPAHFWGAFLRRKLYSPLGFILMVVGTLIYGTFWVSLGFTGGIIALAAYIGGPAGYFGWFSSFSSFIKQRATSKIKVAASKDPVWQQEALQKRVTDVFMKFQADWSSFAVKNMKNYLTPSYFEHTSMIMAALKLRQRRNSVEKPHLIQAYAIEAIDQADDSKDSVTFYIQADAHDRLLESIDGLETELFVDDDNFEEFWTFRRSGQNWLLDEIAQSTADLRTSQLLIKDFAEKNGLYYKMDWGWLLLPRRGQLFGGGKFGTSDINNHVIGTYRDLLVELYTYIPAPKSKNVINYVIAQIALPKRYDSIIVEAKQSIWRGGPLWRRTPSGYNKVTLEWPDFNKRYRVFATDVEQVTAFELLHPVFMEKLFALPFQVSIEVVDNVVYLYSKDNKADYQTMFDVLQAAFKEMKL